MVATKPGRSELYDAFLEFVSNDLQLERRVVNRRMMSVFVWCFMLPVLIAAAIIILTKVHVLPQGARGLIGWLILIFPVFYSLYILWTEFAVGIPTLVRKGGLATSLQRSSIDHAWRKRVTEGLGQSIHADGSQWRWILANFKIDLENMRYRTRYLTALAGAVFFLLMEGIDSIGSDEPVSWVKSPAGWLETAPNNVGQFVGLALFLVLLYVSGNQTHHSLSRYLDCVDLVALEKKDPS